MGVGHVSGWGTKDNGNSLLEVNTYYLLHLPRKRSRRRRVKAAEDADGGSSDGDCERVPRVAPPGRRGQIRRCLRYPSNMWHRSLRIAFLSPPHTLLYNYNVLSSRYEDRHQSEWISTETVIRVCMCVCWMWDALIRDQSSYQFLWLESITYLSCSDMGLKQLTDWAISY